MNPLRTSLFWAKDVKEHLDSILKALFKGGIPNPFIPLLDSTSGRWLVNALWYESKYKDKQHKVPGLWLQAATS